MREIFAVLTLLDTECNKKIKLENNQTEYELKEKIAYWMSQRPNWDSFYMDFAFVLILDYLDFALTDEESHTYGDMADSIRKTLKEDNPQLYKLFKFRKFLSLLFLVHKSV